MFEAMLSGNLHAISNAMRDLERRRRSASLPAPPGPYDALAKDLELETLWKAMAGDDLFLYETAKRAVLSGLPAPEEIRIASTCWRTVSSTPRWSGSSIGSRSKRSPASRRLARFGVERGPTGS